jgi:hypothetical protein
MNRNIFFLLLVAILTYSLCIEAKTYRWVDENGVLRFSDKPPPGMVVEAPAAPDRNLLPRRILSNEPEPASLSASSSTAKSSIRTVIP